MRAFQEDRKLKRKILSRPVLWALFILAAIIAASALRVSWRAYVARDVRQEAEKGLWELEQEKSELETRISRLEYPSGIEKEAKERFNVKSPGEEVLVILDPAHADSGGGNTSAAGFWRAFLRMLKK